MPNHVLNELVFEGISPERRDEIIAVVCNSSGDVDFELLMPLPPNAWLFSVGQKEKETFKCTALDWSRENWGTKWNAYDTRPIEYTNGTLFIQFETAWNPPYGWLVALFNKLKSSFEYRYMDEGGPCTMGQFLWPKENELPIDNWRERECTTVERRRLHKLHFGCEEFATEE